GSARRASTRPARARPTTASECGRIAICRGPSIIEIASCAIIAWVAVVGCTPSANIHALPASGDTSEPGLQNKELSPAGAGWVAQAALVTLAKPYRPGFATTSCNRWKVSTGITL